MNNPSNSYIAADCPVTEAFFAELVSVPLETAGVLVEKLSSTARASLAVYCYRRSHLRRLGLVVASKCARPHLVAEAGHAGELIHLQAQNLDKILLKDEAKSPHSVRRTGTSGLF
ncbi:MAG: hypothetical protein HWE23_08195 [Rhodobacteraceae bacterium]|nr:hypothetical protein [Paracoccaceae bacterium]